MFTEKRLDLMISRGVATGVDIGIYTPPPVVYVAAYHTLAWPSSILLNKLPSRVNKI